jgi:hypothetical protein
MIVSPGVIGPLGTILAKLHPILSRKADKTGKWSQVALDLGLTRTAKGAKPMESRFHPSFPGLSLKLSSI